MAVTGAAKTMVAARRKDVRKGRTDIDEVWDAMDRYERYQMLEAVGSQVLPVLVALPDVEVAAGTRPSSAPPRSFPPSRRSWATSWAG